MSEYKPLTCLPVLPLRGLVVFPGVVTHFDVGRLKSAKSVEEAMRADQRIFLTAQKDLSVDDPKKNDLYAVGTVAIVKQILRMPGDNMRILVEGKFRAELVDCIQSEPYLFARVEEIEEPAYNASLPRVQALLRQAHGAYEQFVELAAKNLQDGLLQVISSDDPGFVADFIAQNSSIVYPDKQKILEQPHPVKRLELTVKLLAKELEILQLENEISEKVQQNVNKGQRDYYLREQMHVIREELGEEDDEADSEGYQEKIRALKLPEETETKLLKEARRLAKQQQNSAEAAVIRNYLDLVLELPWNTRTKERLDVKAAAKDSRRRPLWSRAGQKADSRDARRAAACARASGADSLPGRSSGCRQNVNCDFDRAGAEPKACAHFARRRPRRSGNPRPPQDLHRRHARQDHDRHLAGKEQERASAARRN